MRTKQEVLNEIEELTGVKTNGYDDAMLELIKTTEDEHILNLVDEYHNIVKEERLADLKPIMESMSKQPKCEPEEWVDDEEFRELVGDEVYYESIQIWREKGLIK